MSIVYNEQLSLKCVYGSPFSILDKIEENNIEIIEKSLKNINEKILLCGHTHIQWHKKYKGKIILNPGSVGAGISVKKMAQYSIIEIIKNEIKIEHKNIEYDFEKFKLHNNNDDGWNKIGIKSIEDGIDYPQKLLKELKTRTQEWPIPNKEWNNMIEEWSRKGII